MFHIVCMYEWGCSCWLMDFPVGWGPGSPWGPWAPYLWTFFFPSHSILPWSNLPISCGTGTSGQDTWLHSTRYLPVLNLAAHPLPLLCWVAQNPGLSASVSPHSESPISTRRWGSTPSLWQTPLLLIQGWAQWSCSWESSLILLTLVQLPLSFPS